jgi:hypothetical protein
MPLINHSHHHVHHHYHTDPVVLKKLEKIMSILDDVQNKANTTLAKITADTDIDNAVAKVVDDQRATIIDLRAQLAAAIAAGNDPAKLQALSDTMDAILAADTTNSDIVSKAVTAGTTAATP